MVISRSQKVHVATYESKLSAYGFHVVNAYEENGSVMVDLAVYDNANILEHLRLDNLRSSDPKPLPKSILKRYPLTNVKEYSDKYKQSKSITVVKKMVGEPVTDVHFELPTIHPGKHGHPYRFSYGVSLSEEAKQWSGKIKLWDAIVKMV